MVEYRKGQNLQQSTVFQKQSERKEVIQLEVQRSLQHFELC